MIMIDQIRTWPHARPPFHRGSCHLTCDGALDELHAFATRLGLKREWFQPHVLAPHYDLTPAMRERAVALGAKFVDAREQSRMRRRVSMKKEGP